MRRAGRISTVVLALLIVSGGQWLALQSVAWVSMLIGNLRTQSVAQAVSDTFDGRHPCPLCKAVAEGKKSETKNELTIPSTKLEFASSPPGLILFEGVRHRADLVVAPLDGAQPAKPPTPPPRVLPV